MVQNCKSFFGNVFYGKEFMLSFGAQNVPISSVQKFFHASAKKLEVKKF